MSSTHSEFREEYLHQALRDFSARIATALEPYGLTCGEAAGLGHLVLVNEAKPSTFKNSDAPHGRYRYKDLNHANIYVPHADDPGTYIFFDEQQRGLYVGKAEVGFGWRIASHMRAGAKDFHDDHYLIVIPFKNASFLAPAFESFLLERYHFEWNKSLARVPGVPDDSAS